jgi:succinate dehydrogenase / fumarate reductase membrane anchor subunit
MRLGLQVVIEDYVHTDHTKYALLLINTFFAVVMVVAALFAILKMSIGL